MPQKEQSMSSLQTQSTLSNSTFGSIGNRLSRRGSGSRPALSSTIHSTTDINSIGRRSSSMRRNTSENFVWNNESATGQDAANSLSNKPFGRGRNALTSSLFAPRSRRNSSSRLKESSSTDSFGLNNITEKEPSVHDKLPVLSSHLLRRLGSRLSSDSMASFASFGGDSCATEMSTSNFTLGELKPRKLGMS